MEAGLGTGKTLNPPTCKDTMGFNLKRISEATEAEVEIKDEEGAGTGVFFTLAGPQHPERKRIQFALSRKAIKRYEKTGKAELPDPEEAEEMARENLAAFTLGWRGYTDDQGMPVAFSKAAALELYRDPTMAWLVTQLQTALGETERFMKRSASA